DVRAVVTHGVDAAPAIPHHHRIGLAAAIEAHQQRRRRVGNRTDRGRGGAGLTAGAARGDDVDGGAEPAHRLAKHRGLDRAHGLRTDRREGAVHRVIGPLVDPAHGLLLRGTLDAGHGRIRDVIRVDPSGIAPTVLVVVGKALLGERAHALARTAGARVPQRLDADILVVTGVVHLVELVAAAELGADGVPQQLHHLDALFVADAVRTTHVLREILVDVGIFEVLRRRRKINERRGDDFLHDLLDPAVGIAGEDAVARAGVQVGEHG